MKAMLALPIVWLVLSLGSTRAEDESSTPSPVEAAIAGLGGELLESLDLLDQTRMDRWVRLDATSWRGGEEGFRHLSQLDADKFVAKGIDLTPQQAAYVAQMPRLHAMVLESCKLSDEAAVRLANAQGIGFLTLVEVNVSSAGMAALGSLRNMEMLSLLRTPLTEEGGAVLQKFSKLRDLWIRPVSEDICCHIADLRDLSELTLTGPKITDDSLRHLSGLKKLKTLRLRETSVNGAGLRHLSRQNPLVLLDLTSSAMNDDGLKQVGQLTSIERLSLSDTKVTDEGLQDLHSLDNICRLGLACTNVTGRGLIGWKRMVADEKMGPWTPNGNYHVEVDLAGAAVDDESLRFLTQATAITMLDLGGTRVTGNGLPHLKNLTSLGRLGLQECAIDDSGINNLPALRYLYELYLSGTSVGDTGLKDMPALPSLHELGLARTAITDKGLNHLLRFPCLIELDVSGTHVSKEGVNSFVKQTSCEVTSDVSEKKEKAASY